MAAETAVRVPMTFKQLAILERAAAVLGLPVTTYLRTSGLERAHCQDLLEGSAVAEIAKAAVAQRAGSVRVKAS